MKKIIMALFLCGVLFSSCLLGKEVVTERERTVGTFTGIKSCCGIDVYITQGNSSKIRVEANKEIIDNITTEVINGVLNISVKKNGLDKKIWKNNTMKVYVTAQNLNLIEASSGSDVESLNKLKAQNIKIAGSSGSDISLDLDAENIVCDMSSGSDLELKGSARYGDIDASSGSDIDMKEMAVDKADVKGSSGSDIDIRVKNEIKARASSASDINIYGNPLHADTSSSSGGDINRK